jgi:uncharacterized protein (DUF1800 family)
MRIGRRQIVLLALLAGFCLYALGKSTPKKLPASAAMSEHKRAVHALNRLSFGARPGDVDTVMAKGVDRWINQQLHPEKIDDSALENRLAALPTLRMSTRELVENFPSQQVIKAIADGKQSLPSDPVMHAVYVAQLDRYEEKQERKQESGAEANVKTEPAVMSTSESEQDRANADEKLQTLSAMAPDQRFRAILAMSFEERRLLTPSVKNKADELMEGLTPRQRETIRALNNPQQVVTDELLQGKLLRAIYSEGQLQEVMTDFWFNHFNVFVGKGADRYELNSYERDVIRPHAFGKFEDLLVATAQSPAMLFYLDNWLSVGPNSDFANGIPKRKGNFRQGGKPGGKPGAKRGGLNENYGRELMELHTLGVNGGYKQKDVTEVARVFTGWTIKEPRQGGGFFFDERKHEPGDKIVLGHRIKSKGEKEGREVLHILAHNPSTAQFICTKLAMRFVSDNPPPALVERMAHTFLKKDGDIREVLKTMLDSPEFWADDQYRAKVKTPLEFVVSCLRASGAEVSDAMPLTRQLQAMGMPLYGAQPPTGYSMKADAWINSSALLGRMNFALALTAGKLKGTTVDSERVLGADKVTDAEHSLALLENSLLGNEVSKQTHEVISARLQDPGISRRKLDDPSRPPNLAIIEGLLLGSPEFQRR